MKKILAAAITVSLVLQVACSAEVKDSKNAIPSSPIPASTELNKSNLNESNRKTTSNIDNGGIISIISPDNTNGSKVSITDLNKAKEIILKRLRSLSSGPFLVDLNQKADSISVKIDRGTITDANELGNLCKTVTSMGNLTIQEVDEPQDILGSYKATGKYIVQGIDMVGAEIMDYDNSFKLIVTLSKGGKIKFEKATERLIGKRVGIFIDDQFISAPTINEKISNGVFEVTGSQDLKELRELACIIKTGPLPFKTLIKDCKLYEGKRKDNH